MSIEENRAIIRRYYDEVINRRHLAVLDEMLAPLLRGSKPKVEIVPAIAKTSNTSWRSRFIPSLSASRPFTIGTVKRMSW